MTPSAPDDRPHDLEARVAATFDRLLDVEPADRPVTLRQLCAGDDLLQERVAALLASHAASGGFLDDLAEGSAAPAVGDTLGGRYTLTAELGAGGAGTVYEARDELRGRRVAVKVQHGDGLAAQDRRERAMLRGLRIPGVVRILDEGAAAGHRYLVTEHVEGAPFPGRPTPAAWHDIRPAVLGLLEALARIHWRGVVHADLKPANVLVDEHDVVTIVDLGTSLRLDVAEREALRGFTDAYAAPEQRAAGTLDGRTDLYAVGVMLHEALTGARPPAAGPGDATPRADASALEGRAPPEVLETIHAMLAPDPAARPDDATAVLDALRGDAPSAVEAREAYWRRAWDGASRVDASQLAAVFTGHERLFRIPSDAARALHERTGGNVTKAFAELDAWHRSGIGRWEGHGFQIERDRIPALEAEDDATRFHEALAAGDLAAVAALAAPAAEARRHAGDIHGARAIALEGLRALDADAPEAQVEALLLRLLQASMQAARPAAFELFLHEAGSLPSTPGIARLEAIARTALRALRGELDAARAEVVDPRECTSDAERRCAVAATLFLARRLPDPVEERAAVEEVLALGRELGAGAIRAAATSALAWFAYREEDYARAADLHLEAAELADETLTRTNTHLNAASALMEAGDFDRAVALARGAQGYAAEIRHSLMEARALWIERAAAYRRGDRLAPDEPLALAASEVGDAHLGALVALGEAALARRAEEHPLAARLANLAASLWERIGAEDPAVLAHALACACGGTDDTPSARELLDRVQNLRMPTIAVQAARLIAWGEPTCRNDVDSLVRARTSDLPTSNRALCMEVLSLDEALETGAD